MQINTRRLFALILLAQCGCVAVGLGFQQLYISSAMASAGVEETLGELTRQYKTLAAPLADWDPKSAPVNEQAWQEAVARWRTTADRDDHLYLLDGEGRIVAADGPTHSAVAVHGGESLKLTRATAPWGHFGEPIHGVLKVAGQPDRVVLARNLESHGGYLLMTRVAKAERVDAAMVQHAAWAAGGITLLWTIVLQAATLFMIIAYFKQWQSSDAGSSGVNALKQAQALVRTQETVIFGLAKLSDSRDADTGSHLERIAHYSSALTAAARQRPEFRQQIMSGFMQQIGISSALHDIGKVGVEDSILCKPGPLTPEERARMQRHTQIGEECLMEIERRLGSSNFLQMAREISSAHHERWDGLGYPAGLVGEQIPLSARIVALADVYDALAHKRVYKEAMSHEHCVRIIAEAAGSHFDPRLVEVFLEIEDRFRQISQQFATEANSRITETSESAKAVSGAPTDSSDFIAAVAELMNT